MPVPGTLSRISASSWTPWLTIISGFRLIAAENGIVIAASYWGKFKTAFSMIMVIVMVLDIDMPFFYILGQILMWISLALTVISLIDYIVKNRDVLKEQS